VQILEEHRKNCEQRGKYPVTETTKNRSEYIKKQIGCRKVELMLDRHIAKQLGVENEL
jgi:hypothetical protein